MVLAGVVVLGVKPKRSHAHQESSEALVAPEARRNLLKEQNIIASYLHHVWAEDFTYLKFQGKWYYLATIIDLYSRQIVGWALSIHHDTDLITAALLDALSRHEPPAICHQDQGSEYVSERYDIIALSLGIELSFSDKGSPWENGFQESFYRPFKLEIGARKLDRFGDIGELMEAIAKQMRYYNTQRIHSALRMSPLAFATSGLPPRNTTKHKTRPKTKTDIHMKQQKQYEKTPTVLQQILTGVRDKVFIIFGA